MERPKRQWGVRKAVTSLERGGPRRAVNWIPSDNRLIISVNQVRGVGGNNNTTRRKKENTHTKKQRGNISNINRICRLIAIPRLLTISQWIGGGRVKCCLRWLLPTITAGGTSTAAAADVTATAAASAAAVVGGGFTLHIKPPGHVLKSYQSNKRIKEREKERERKRKTVKTESKRKNSLPYKTNWRLKSQWLFHYSWTGRQKLSFQLDDESIANPLA